MHSALTYSYPHRRRSRLIKPGTILWISLAIAVGVLASFFAYEAIAGAVVSVLALVIVLPILLPRLLPQEDRAFTVKVVAAALFVKLVAVGLRIWFAEGVYGYGDSLGYDAAGEEIAGFIRAGDFAAATANLQLGTETVRFITGVLYSVIGHARWGGFLAFASFSFVGTLMFYRAFRMAFPNASHRWLLVLLLFHPSLMFWPSAIGKDALLILSVGLASWGVALLAVKQNPVGLLGMGLGVGLALLIRPPTAMILVMAAIPAIMLTRPQPSLIGYSGKIVTIGLIVIGGLGIAIFGTRALELKSISAEAVLDRFLLESRRDYDEGGTGSNFEVVEISDPGWLPSAIVTVLVRPFPWEARNPQMLLQSVDGLITSGIILVAFVNLLRNGVSVRNKSFILYLIIAATALILILSALGNFGLLARQRATALPFVFAILALPAARRDRHYIQDATPVSELAPTLQVGVSR